MEYTNFGLTVTQTDETPPKISWTDYFIPILLEDIISDSLILGMNIVFDCSFVIEEIVYDLKEVAKNVVIEQFKDFERIDILTFLSDFHHIKNF